MRSRVLAPIGDFTVPRPVAVEAAPVHRLKVHTLQGQPTFQTAPPQAPSHVEERCTSSAPDDGLEVASAEGRPVANSTQSIDQTVRQVGEPCEDMPSRSGRT